MVGNFISLLTTAESSKLGKLAPTESILELLQEGWLRLNEAAGRRSSSAVPAEVGTMQLGGMIPLIREDAPKRRQDSYSRANL
jgi:hypothetical protein